MNQTILITVDALRQDHLSQYGYSRDTMPSLDTLIEDGLQLNRHFSNGSNSGESIPSILTSRYAPTDEINAGPTIASALPDQVRTAAFHSNPLLAQAAEDRVAGFDFYQDYNVDSTERDDPTDSLSRRAYRNIVSVVKPIVGNNRVTRTIRNSIVPSHIAHKFTPYEPAEEVIDDVLSWISSNKHQDFFVWVHLMDPHRPYGIDLRDSKYTPVPDEDEIKQLMTKAGIQPSEVSKEEIQRMIDLYDSDIRYLSDELDRLYTSLQNLELWENLNVILSSDHGEEFGEHGLFYHRNRPYDELTSVPLVLKTDNDIQEENITEAVDLAPTILSFYDTPAPKGFDGEVIGDKSKNFNISTGSFQDDNQVVSVRTDTHKLMITNDGDIVYDIHSDPREKDQISNSDAIVSDLKSYIPKSVSENSGFEIETPENDAMEERLRDLGYLE